MLLEFFIYNDIFIIYLTYNMLLFYFKYVLHSGDPSNGVHTRIFLMSFEYTRIIQGPLTFP